jgi:hypothetical protein
MPITEHKVSFGQLARTLLYEDVRGTLCFCFDISSLRDPQDGKYTIFLGHQAISGDYKKIDPSEEEKLRIDAAWEHANTFLVSCGYKVVIDED